MSNLVEELITQLVALGVPPGVAGSVVNCAYVGGIAEGQKMAPPDRAAEKRREWDRNRKAAAKALRNSGGKSNAENTGSPVVSTGKSGKSANNSTGIPVSPQSPDSSSFFLSESVVEQERKGRKNMRASAGIPVEKRKPDDDWPDDYAKLFWDAWPSHPRKHSEKQVAAKLARIRASREATWAEVYGGEQRYFASNPEAQFIPGLLPWLNAERWKVNPKMPASLPKANGGSSFLSYAREQIANEH